MKRAPRAGTDEPLPRRSTAQFVAENSAPTVATIAIASHLDDCRVRLFALVGSRVTALRFARSQVNRHVFVDERVGRRLVGSSAAGGRAALRVHIDDECVPTPSTAYAGEMNSLGVTPLTVVLEFLRIGQRARAHPVVSGPEEHAFTLKQADEPVEGPRVGLPTGDELLARRVFDHAVDELGFRQLDDRSGVVAAGSRHDRRHQRVESGMHVDFGGRASPDVARIWCRVVLCLLPRRVFCNHRHTPRLRATADETGAHKECEKTVFGRAHVEPTIARPPANHKQAVPASPTSHAASSASSPKPLTHSPLRSQMSAHEESTPTPTHTLADSKNPQPCPYSSQKVHDAVGLHPRVRSIALDAQRADLANEEDHVDEVRQRARAVVAVLHEVARAM